MPASVGCEARTGALVQQTPAASHCYFPRTPFPIRSKSMPQPPSTSPLSGTCKSTFIISLGGSQMIFRFKNAIRKMKHIREEKWIFPRNCFRLFLCASIALYQLSSYIHRVATDHSVALTRTTLAHSAASLHSHAVMEPCLEDRKQRHPPTVKIFVYDLPSRYNEDWLSDPRCSTHLFAAEVAIHRALMSSTQFRTDDPSEADFYFIPVYVSCNFSTANGFPAIGHARTLLASAVSLISSEFPFWNRSGGRDHIFVASHDFGACFHAMEHAAISEGIPSFMRRSIILQTFGVTTEHACQAAANIVIPPYVSPESVLTTLQLAGKSSSTRHIWAFFRGKMEVHAKNISGHFYSNGVRTAIWHQFNGDKRFHLMRHRDSGYQLDIARSVFCICPRGWAPWSPRLVESVALGCIPVIIADDIRLPFPAAVPWPEISLTVREKDVHRLPRILHGLTATNLSAIQRTLSDASIRRALFFNPDIGVGDATWQIMTELSAHLHRSLRRSQSRTFSPPV